VIDSTVSIVVIPFTFNQLSRTTNACLGEIT